MIKQICGLLAGLAACALAASGQTNPGWSLVWADEFSQPDGSSPSSTKWAYDTGGGGWGNSERENYTTRTNNARILNGMLVIEAKAESYQGSSYTSARLKTQGKWSWTYGRVEARIKIPRGQGIWPAFWMLGSNITPDGWPACGEIDIMENIGREPTLVHGTIHGPGYSGANGIGGPGALPGNPTFADDFHVYAVEWTTNQMKWFVDNHQYFSANTASLPGGASWVYTQPQFLLLNVAVGGQWPGDPDGTTVFPQQMLVDYVRVYSATNLPVTGTNFIRNASFESGLTNWTASGAGFNTLLENVPDVSVHNGTNVFKIFGQFTGNPNDSRLYQDISIAAGQAFKARGWIFTSGSDQIAGANTAWIDVSFRNASSNVLALYRSTPVSASSPTDLWLNYPVTNQLDPGSLSVTGSVNSLVAPPGTSFIRYQAVFHQTANSSGSVYYDDLRLSPAGTNAIPAPVALVSAGGNASLIFPTYLNRAYQVTRKNSLSDPAWLVVTNLSGTGTNQTLPVDLQASVRFFNVSRLCD